MRNEIPEQSALDRLADEAGIAIALVDASSREVHVVNNNSICRTLNPSGEFSAHCKAYCGTAFEEANEVGSTVSFTCHAGLECRVVPQFDREKRLVAIVGRTFITSENYRRATTRAITGDWKDLPPGEFFENVLLTPSSSVLDKAAARVAGMQPLRAVENTSVDKSEKVDPAKARDAETAPPAAKKPAHRPVSNLVSRFNREMGLEAAYSTPDEPTDVPVAPAVADPPEATQRVSFDEAVETESPRSGGGQIATDESEQSQSHVRLTAEARAWRSFFGSLLRTDYWKAVDSMLEFIALQYGRTSLVWLERNDGRLENASAFGPMKARRVRLGIAADDPRLLEAARNELPLELAERPKPDVKGSKRLMYLFPIGLTGEIAAGIAIFDEIEDEKVKRQIARICLSVAPQLEILRLRNAVERGQSLSTAVRRFSENLKQIDSEDLWIKLTQCAAEMVRAERASLMVFNERSRSLELKALIGGRSRPNRDEPVGSRVARLVFDKNRPIIVPDVAKTGLPPAAAGRNYKTASFMSCPLSVGGRTIGVMSFADKASGQPFDKASLNLFQAIAPQLAVAIDRASLKDKAGELEQLSVTDALTGLLNRRYLEARLTEEVKRSNRHGFPMSFMMIDVDHFKPYNDEFGHPAGDEALKLVGNVIRETLRGADIAARYGGEEFSILLPQTTTEEAMILGERLRRNIADTNFPHRKVTTSIGVASCSAELCSAKNLVNAADAACYEAKRLGRDRVVASEQVQKAASPHSRNEERKG